MPLSIKIIFIILIMVWLGWMMPKTLKLYKMKGEKTDMIMLIGMGAMLFGGVILLIAEIKKISG